VEAGVFWSTMIFSSVEAAAQRIAKKETRRAAQ